MKFSRVSIDCLLSVSLVFSLTACGSYQKNTINSMTESKTNPVSSPVKFRGVIEGFYGTPWSNQERIHIFDFLHKENLNTYVYAPKDDPYQRLDWRTLYPPSLLSGMRNLVSAAAQDEVTFVYSISPGMTSASQTAVNKSITYSSVSDRKLLESKMDQLRSIGVHSTLNQHIQAIWTGKWVLNNSITSVQAKTITTLFGRKPILWDNYPVNDYTYVQNHKPQLFMGPLEGRDQTLVNHIAGYISNPMIQPYASELPLMTISDYLSHPTAYHAKSSWDSDVLQMPGVENPRLFKIFAALNSPNMSPVQSMISSYEHSPSAANERVLKSEFILLGNLPTTLPKSISNPRGVKEIQPWLYKLGAEGQGGLDAHAFMDSPSATNKQKLEAQLKKINTSSYIIGRNIISFMQWAEKQS